MRARNEDLPTAMEGPGWWSREADWGSMRVAWQHADVEVDTSDVFRPLPGGTCPCEHWGYVTSGTITFRYADGDDVAVGAGESYYARPGHVCLIAPHTELVEFTDRKAYADLVEALGMGAVTESTGSGAGRP